MIIDQVIENMLAEKGIPTKHGVKLSLTSSKHSNIGPEQTLWTTQNEMEAGPKLPQKKGIECSTLFTRPVLGVICTDISGLGYHL